MQLAFECTTLERVEVRDADANSEEGEGDSTSSEDESIGEGRQGRRPRWKMVRKLRVHTIKTDVASSPRVVLDHTRFNVIISLLTQGVVQATLCEGVQEARMLIRDWLINFFVCYNKVTSTSLEQPDMTLERATACVSAPRLIFSMLKHKLLSRDHVHPDQRV
jgi:protein transport protein SEC24